MAKKDMGESRIDLRDPEVRKMLHDDDALRSQAIKSGIANGALVGLLGSVESFFVLPEFAHKLRNSRPGDNLPRRLMETVRNNKLLASLVAAPVVLGAIAGAWGYVSAQSYLHRKKRELDALEHSQPHSEAPLSKSSRDDTPMPPAEDGPAWAERMHARAQSQQRAR